MTVSLMASPRTGRASLVVALAIVGPIFLISERLSIMSACMPNNFSCMQMVMWVGASTHVVGIQKHRNCVVENI